MSDPICEMCKHPASTPGVNDRGDFCPCRCHPGISERRLPDDELIARVAWLDDALTAERALADDAADLLTILKRRPKYADDRPAINVWLARHREARPQ